MANEFPVTLLDDEYAVPAQERGPGNNTLEKTNIQYQGYIFKRKTESILERRLPV